jgi:hypothetical protein
VVQTINLPMNTPATITIKGADASGKFEPLPPDITFTLSNSAPAVLEVDLTADHVGAPAVRMKAVAEGTDIKVGIDNSAGLPPMELLVNVLEAKPAKSLTLDVANMVLGAEEPAAAKPAPAKPAPAPATTPHPPVKPAPPPAPAGGKK